MTYSGLLDQSAAVATRLLEAGLGCGTTVAVLGPRRPDLVAAVVGVLRSGAAFLLLDAAAPAAHVRSVLECAGAGAVLTPPDWMGQGSTGPGSTGPGSTGPGSTGPGSTGLVPAGGWVALPWSGSPTRSLSPGLPTRRPDDLAYVAFTSGSSGSPKCVLVSDGNLSSYAQWAAEAYDLRPGGRTLVQSPVALDFTITTLLCPLLVGGQLELVEGDGPDMTLDALRGAPGYDLVKLTPSHLELAGRHLGPAELVGVARTIVVGGEPLHSRQVLPWQLADPGIALVNEYGPTEATVGCAAYRVGPVADVVDAPIPIGAAIPGAALHLFDAAGGPVAHGRVGEIWVGGSVVASGYRGGNDDDPRFVNHGALGRLYRTGDLARATTDGLVFVGRLDDQIKVNGHRVEPAEVATTIVGHPAIANAVVTMVGGRTRPRRLVAYVVADGSPPHEDELREHLLERLPAHQVPAMFVFLPELPLTAGGKLDRRALPAPGRTSPVVEGPLVDPATPEEGVLAAICAEVLDLPMVGAQDDLFSLGADSRVLAEIGELIANRLGAEVELEDLFEHPSVAAIADLVVHSLPEVPR